MKSGRWRQLSDALADVLFPQDAQCLLCGAPSFGETLCAGCAETLRQLRLREPLCPRCGRPLRGTVCRQCADGDRIRTRSAFLHRDAAAGLIHRLKFHPAEAAAAPLAAGMAEAVRVFDLPPDAVITWVPMPPGRRRQRGIDHARTLALSLAKKTGLTARPLLRRLGETHTQRGLSGAERRVNLKGAFGTAGDCDAPVLLVDDVMTTGATLQTCGALLLDTGCPAVYGVTATQAI